MISSKHDGWNSLFVPSRFEMHPISQLFDQRRTPTDSVTYAPLSVGKAGVTPQLENVAKSGKDDGRKLVKAGDIVINSRSDRRGAAGLSDRDGSVSNIYIVLEPRKKLIDPAFAHHLIRSVAFQEEFYRNGTGIVDDLWSTNYTRMSRIKIPLPEIAKQRQIISYLESETEQIDAMIADLDVVIEQIRGRSSELIRQACWGEVGPGVGEIDSHRQVPLWFYTEVGPLVPEFRTLPEGALVDFLPLENVWPDGRADYSEQKNWKKSETSYTKFRRGDILVPKVTPTVFHGRSMIAETSTEVGLASSEVHTMRVHEDVDPKWITYLMRSSQFLEACRAEVKGVAGLKRISTQFLSSFKVPVTSLTMQSKIVDFLAGELQQTDTLLAEASHLRNLFKERRALLITETITGRKEI